MTARALARGAGAMLRSRPFLIARTGRVRAPALPRGGIDYTWQDFTQRAEAYDVIIDAVGKLPASQAKKALRKNGVYLNVNKDSGSVNKLKTEDLVYLKGLIEACELKAFIDRCYPMEQIVEAHRYVELGHKRCNVAITIQGKI